MKKSNKMALIFALASLVNPENSISSEKEPKKPLTPEEKEFKRQKIHKNNGLKRFEFNGKIVFALNKKNAIKKAKKRGIL